MDKRSRITKTITISNKYHYHFQEVYILAIAYSAHYFEKLDLMFAESAPQN